MQSTRHKLRWWKTIPNGFGALLVTFYGWYCWQFDVFFVPATRNGLHSYQIHGIPCKLMVGALACIAVLILLPALRTFLKPEHGRWCERAWWPVAWTSIGFAVAGLFLDLFIDAIDLLLSLAIFGCFVIFGVCIWLIRRQRDKQKKGRWESATPPKI
jgi:hypothetical protein